jgi:hypothetical protein
MWLVTLAVSLAGVAVAAEAFAAASFSDPAGDQKGTPGAGLDITAVDVTHASDGLITFRVRIANYQVLPPTSFIAVFLDLDRDFNTGDLGDDVQIGWSPSLGVAIERWDGAHYVSAPADSLTAGFSDGLFTLTIPRSELGSVGSFDFLVGTSAVLDGTLNTDVAPAISSRWTYDLIPLVMSASRLVGSRAQPVAGKRFVVSTRISRADTGVAVTAGSVTCTARVGTTKLRATGRFAGGVAQCVMSVPRGATGKALRGTVTIRAGGGSLQKPYSFRVASK